MKKLTFLKTLGLSLAALTVPTFAKSKTQAEIYYDRLVTTLNESKNFRTDDSQIVFVRGVLNDLLAKGVRLPCIEVIDSDSKCDEFMDLIRQRDARFKGTRCMKIMMFEGKCLAISMLRDRSYDKWGSHMVTYTLHNSPFMYVCHS